MVAYAAKIKNVDPEKLASVVKKFGAEGIQTALSVVGDAGEVLGNFVQAGADSVHTLKEEKGHDARGPLAQRRTFRNAAAPTV